MDLVNDHTGLVNIKHLQKHSQKFTVHLENNSKWIVFVEVIGSHIQNELAVIFKMNWQSYSKWIVFVELVEVIGSHIQDGILKKVKQAKLFSVIPDEAVDVEICLQFVTR